MDWLAQASSDCNEVGLYSHLTWAFFTFYIHSRGMLKLVRKICYFSTQRCYQFKIHHQLSDVFVRSFVYWGYCYSVFVPSVRFILISEPFTIIQGISRIEEPRYCLLRTKLKTNHLVCSTSLFLSYIQNFIPRQELSAWLASILYPILWLLPRARCIYAEL